MIESSIARRYAKALLDIASESGQTSLFLSELDSFHNLCLKHPSLMDVLSNRFMDLTARMNIVDELAGRLKLNPMIRNFLKLLIKKGRAGFLDFIVKAYQKLVYELEGKLEAVITSAKPLNDLHYKEIQKILSKITGKKIIAQKDIKPEVLGGLAIRIGGEVYDGTIRASLNKIGEEMRKGTSYAN